MKKYLITSVGSTGKNYGKEKKIIGRGGKGIQIMALDKNNSINIWMREVAGETLVQIEVSSGWKSRGEVMPRGKTLFEGTVEEFEKALTPMVVTETAKLAITKSRETMENGNE